MIGDQVHNDVWRSRCLGEPKDFDSFPIGSLASLSALPRGLSAFIIKQYVSAIVVGCNFSTERGRSVKTCKKAKSADKDDLLPESALRQKLVYLVDAAKSSTAVELT
jgi:hypothetical protein